MKSLLIFCLWVTVLTAAATKSMKIPPTATSSSPVAVAKSKSKMEDTFRITIDSRVWPHPKAKLKEIGKLLEDAGVGSVENFDHGRVKPSLHGIVTMKALGVLTRAHIKWKAVRWSTQKKSDDTVNNKSSRDLKTARDHLTKLRGGTRFPSPHAAEGSRESQGDFPAPSMHHRFSPE